MEEMKSKIVNELNEIYLGKLRKSWVWLMTIGIFFLIIGSIAIMKSLTTTIISLYILGFVFLLIGIGYSIYSFKFLWNNWAKFFQYMLLGIVYLVASVIIIRDPISSAFPLTIFIAIFYMFVGLWRTITAFQFKPPRAILELLGGVLALLFGILVWLQWPSASLWVIGLFVGIDIFLLGVYFTALSMYAKKLSIEDVI